MQSKGILKNVIFVQYKLPALLKIKCLSIHYNPKEQKMTDLKYTEHAHEEHKHDDHKEHDHH